MLEREREKNNKENTFEIKSNEIIGVTKTLNRKFHLSNEGVSVYSLPEITLNGQIWKYRSFAYIYILWFVCRCAWQLI